MRRWKLALLTAMLAVSMVLVGAPAMAATSSTSWDFAGPGNFFPRNSENVIADLTLPDPAGSVCRAVVEAVNPDSIHLGHDVKVYQGAALLLTVAGVEDAAGTKVGSVGFTSTGETLTVTMTTADDPRTSSRGSLTVTCEEPPGGEGCTPGYWKQPHHFDSWVGYAPGDSFNTVFGVASGFTTLLQGLEAGGGGQNALARHAVAALLNTSSPSVDYEFTTAQVIALVQNAYATGNYEAAKNILAAENEAGCPLD